VSRAVRFQSWNTNLQWTHWIGFFTWLAGFVFIHRQVSKLLPEHDPYLLPIASFLSGWGLLTIWRLDPYFGVRQTVWLVVCLLIFWIGLKEKNFLTYLKRYKYLWLFFGLLLTALTFVLGIYPGGEGPHLWLGCCGIYFQPSELLKLLLIAYIAAYLSSQLSFWPSLLQLLAPTLVLGGMVIALMLGQRDLGTASIFILLYFLIIYLVTGKRRILLFSLLLLIAAVVIGYTLLGIIRFRIDAWLNPWLDPSGRSYQIIQSIMAVAAGGLFGRGPGLGFPTLVPIAQSDFIYAAIAEETGLTGTIGIICLLALLIGRGMNIAIHAANNYQRYLSAGITAYFTIQSVLIIGGNLRLLPLTGVTLPFVSYGGSSLLISFIALLILCLVSANREDEPAPLQQVYPYHLVLGAFLVSLLAIALVNGYWAVIRSADLLQRTDNPRRAINDIYVYRGALLDRNNLPITQSKGTPGNYTRQVLYPPLGLVVGYNNAYYGQAGLEASLDPYLRGQKGYPGLKLWQDHLLLGQSPPGLDIRLSLDIELQRKGDDLLGDKTGAIVILNAASGEVLALVSHPGFDPNTLEENWSQWVNDSGSPLLNRAVQSQYPIGTSLGTFLYASAAGQGILPEPPINPSSNLDGKRIDCLQTPSLLDDWSPLISNGCPGASVTLGRVLGLKSIMELYHQLGFDQTPDFPIAQANAIQIPETMDPILAALGQGEIKVTPLQMALAAATISTGGILPAPFLAMAVNTPQQGWVIFPSASSSVSFSETGANKAATLLAIKDAPLWQSLGSAQTGKGQIIWYLAGTSPDWKGSPLAIALILEENNPGAAQRIGSTLMQETLEQ
jgi:cell division protein FtsW (lipid II flippase)